MTVFAKSGQGHYPSEYVGSILRACVSQFTEWRVFMGALTGPENFTQRKIPTGQQVFDTEARVNIELGEKFAVIYVPWLDSAEVSAGAARILGEITNARFDMEPRGDTAEMIDITSATARPAGSDLEYILSVWSAKVPGEEDGAPERDGSHVMLSVNDGRGAPIRIPTGKPTKPRFVRADELKDLGINGRTR